MFDKSYVRLMASVGVTALLCSSSPAQAQDVGAAASFAVVAYSAVTVDGAGSVINGNVGVSPGFHPAITGIPGNGIVIPPFTTFGAPSISDAAQAAAGTLNLALSADACTNFPGSVDLSAGSGTFGPGIHCFGAGTVILPATENVTLIGSSTDIFIFRALSDLTTFSTSTMTLVGVNPCNVYWQVATQATLANDILGFPFVGTVVAGSAVVLNPNAGLTGRALALTAAVTLAGGNTVGGCSGGTVTVIKNTGNPLNNGTFNFTGDLGAFAIATVSGTGTQTFTNVQPTGGLTLPLQIFETAQLGWTIGSTTCFNLVVPQAPLTVECEQQNTMNAAAQIKVHILKYLDGVMATFASAGGYQFPMVSTWNAANLGAGSGNYVLGNGHGGAANLYGADTSFMDVGADYTTSEVTNGLSLVLPVEGTCVPGQFRLLGYSTSPTDFTTAAAAGTSTSAPIFTNLQADQYVIVRNITCPPAPTTGTLTVTKTAVGGNGTFTFSGPGGTFTITTVLGTGTKTFLNLPPGPYSIVETGLPLGWGFTSSTCGSVTVSAGGLTTCTVVNTRPAICPDVIYPTVSLWGVINGPPKKIVLKAVDTGSGIRNITVIVSTNIASVTYSLSPTGSPLLTSFPVTGITAPIYIFATKANQSLGSVLGVTVTDQCLQTVFDPYDVTVSVGTPVTVADVPSDEYLVQIANNGLTAMTIAVNGRRVEVSSLQPRETRTVNIRSYMTLDLNTITFVARGRKGSSASVLGYPPPAGGEAK